MRRDCADRSFDGLCQPNRAAAVATAAVTPRRVAPQPPRDDLREDAHDQDTIIPGPHIENANPSGPSLVADVDWDKSAATDTGDGLFRGLAWAGWPSGAHMTRA